MYMCKTSSRINAVSFFRPKGVHSFLPDLLRWHVTCRMCQAKLLPTEVRSPKPSVRRPTSAGNVKCNRFSTLWARVPGLHPEHEELDGFSTSQQFFCRYLAIILHGIALDACSSVRSAGLSVGTTSSGVVFIFLPSEYPPTVDLFTSFMQISFRGSCSWTV